MLHAQVPGRILDAATLPNPMDVNSDGFITSTGLPFSGLLDETEFELPFFPLQQYENEHGFDNHHDTACKFYELIDDVSGDAHTAYYYFTNPDGLTDNGDELILFRLRTATFGSASTTFAILIDTDYRFGFSGPEADPNAVAGNPGFEKEVALFTSTGSSGGVKVFNVDGRSHGGVLNFQAPTSSHHQVSYALNKDQDCTEVPVFVDFYIPFSALAISSATQIRIAVAANNNLSSSLGGGAVDIGGVDGNVIVDNDVQFMAAIGIFSPIAVINPLNQAPATANASIALDENSPTGTIIHNVSASDVNGNVLTYSITSGNTLSAFVIDSNTGQITVGNSAALDFEETASFTLLVRASDGQLYDNAIITVNLRDVNEPPSGIDALVSVDENLANGSSVHFVAASDPDANTNLQYSIAAGNSAGAFRINNKTGELTVADASLLNFESNLSFNLNVHITDGLLSDDVSIELDIADVNEAPSITGTTIGLDEHVDAGTPVHTFAASDPDAGTSLEFSIAAGNTGSAFSIDKISGTITVTDSHALNFETSPVFQLTVRVSDGFLFTEAMAIINVHDINEPPWIADAFVTVEHRLSDHDIVFTVVASDPDAGNVLTYTINSGNTDNLLALDPNTGAISVPDARPFHLKPYTFDLQVSATDKAGLSGSGLIRLITVRVPARSDIRPQKGFSPDGNGSNDFWFIEGIEAFPRNTIQVFNRWGIPVFEAQGYDNERLAWRGEQNGRRTERETTFFYVIKVADFEPITGYVIVKP